ncbi:MAG TPA: hypothetical protein VK810_01970 [Dongiaceae bacterium]|jgi:hypothetical protein|nr:hypothetical protein [Dongiaceae bacterium]
MARKIETWGIADIPDPVAFAKICENLSPREILIISCSILDSLLADLISTTLIQDEKEVEAFIGLDGNGRAPLGSFGSRIQAAYLLGQIDDFNMKVLRTLKDVRNIYSHQVRVSLDDPRILGRVKGMIDYSKKMKTPPSRKRAHQKYRKMVEDIPFDKGAVLGYCMGAAVCSMGYIAQKIQKRATKKRPKTK